MSEEIHCLMFAGAPLDDGLRTALYLTACGLIRSGESYGRFIDENGQGGVTTKHKRQSIGAIAGIVFEATIDWKQRTITSKFIVRDVGMPSEEEILCGDRCQWMPLRPPEDDADWWKH